jgi:hypothetical protein
MVHDGRRELGINCGAGSKAADNKEDANVEVVDR